MDCYVKEEGAFRLRTNVVAVISSYAQSIHTVKNTGPPKDPTKRGHDDDDDDAKRRLLPPLPLFSALLPLELEREIMIWHYLDDPDHFRMMAIKEKKYHEALRDQAFIVALATNATATQAVKLVDHIKAMFDGDYPTKLRLLKKVIELAAPKPLELSEAKQIILEILTSPAISDADRERLAKPLWNKHVGSLRANDENHAKFLKQMLVRLGILQLSTWADEVFTILAGGKTFDKLVRRLIKTGITSDEDSLMFSALGNYKPEGFLMVANVTIENAARLGLVGITSLLLNRGENIEKIGFLNQTPLQWAAWDGHTETVRLLLDRGARIEGDRNGRRWTPLHYAAEKGHTETVRLLLDRGANIDAEDNKGRTPWHVALRHGYTEIVRLMLEKGALLEARTNGGGWTPLQVAVKRGYTEIVRLLLEKGAFLEAKNRDSGWTPLHLAAHGGHTEIVRLLLEKGALLEAKNNGGWTPLQVAAYRRHTKIVQMLENAMMTH